MMQKLVVADTAVAVSILIMAFGGCGTMPQPPFVPLKMAEATCAAWSGDLRT
jgi:hypothetical protein